jgi:diamine N-acetyltransferase
MGERLPDEGANHPIVNIVGEKVALGPLHRDLLPLDYGWTNDLATLRMQGSVPAPWPMERIIRRYESGTTAPDLVLFAIYERAILPGGHPRPIGVTNLQAIDYRHGTAEFVIFIGAADARGKGYGTETTRLMLDYAFTALGLYNVALTVAEWNVAGQRAYARAGFRECGRRRQCWLMGGRRWDQIAMDCLATEFTSPALARIFAPDAPRDAEGAS